MSHSIPKCTAWVTTVKSFAEDLNLQHLRGILRTYPGSKHWHFQKPGERGTLEATLWPARNQVWFSV